MTNLRMEEKLKAGVCVAVDTIGKEVANGVWLLPDNFNPDGIDLCVKKTEEWIFSIGKSKASGDLYAATDNRFYQNPTFECIWLR